jgi:beta-phosphoglucomutase
MKRAVLFDMDGVLVASGPAHAASWRVLARRHGIELSDERFRETFGLTSRDIVRIIWGNHLSDDQVRAIDDEKERIYRELITGMIPLTIGVREMLDGLRAAGCVLAVASSGPRENVELVLCESRLEPYFACTVCGDEVRRGKPAPDCFLLAAERCGASPAACVVVEDAAVGIEAALAAGMKVAGFAGTHSAERLRAAGAHVVAERLSEITIGLICSLIPEPDGDPR